MRHPPRLERLQCDVLPAPLLPLREVPGKVEGTGFTAPVIIIKHAHEA